MINVISHCAHLPLPGISVYGATKAALHAWTVALRVELEVHDVKMITFLPGNYNDLIIIINKVINLMAFNLRIVLSSFCHHEWPTTNDCL